MASWAPDTEPRPWPTLRPGQLERVARRALLPLAIVAAFWPVPVAHARPAGFGGCWFLCKERHPVRSQYPHGVCRTVACEAKKNRDDNSEGVPSRSNRPRAYPCAVNWVYNGLPYTHLRYGPRGPYSRNRVGHDYSHRRCL